MKGLHRVKTQKKQLYSPHPLIENCIPQFSTAFENCIPHRTLPRRYNQPEALSIQQKFRVLQMSEISGAPKGTVDYDPNQGTKRLVIVLVSRIQKSGTRYKRFGKWKGTQLDRSNWTILKGGPKYSGRTEPK